MKRLKLRMLEIVLEHLVQHYDWKFGLAQTSWLVSAAPAKALWASRVDRAQAKLAEVEGWRQKVHARLAEMKGEH